MAVYMRNLKLNTFLSLGVHNLQVCLLGGRSNPLPLLNEISCSKSQHIHYRYRHLHTSVVHFKRRKSTEEKKAPRIIEYPGKSKTEVIDVWHDITLRELANVLKRDIQYVRDLFLNEIRDPNTPIGDIKYLQNAVRRGGKRIKLVARPTNIADEEKRIDLEPRPPPPKEALIRRPPVVTVMGHVDHGKTTLLDALRHSSIVEKEFGGITQHIGAFLVTLQSGAKITFLDTPGHAAFSSMRARGANVTDIVVLVVAADDGVMEQTVESVRMAMNAKVPIVVAINKIDAPKADIDRTERMLLEVGIQVERLGGDVQAVPISALKKENLDHLTEALILQADLLNVGGDPTGLVEAVIVESNLHPFRGKVTTVVVQRGTLRIGNILVAGTSIAKVRALRDADGNSMDKAPPGYPAEIDGWRDLPGAGELVLEAQSEKEAKQFREEELEKNKLAEDLKVIQQKQDVHNRAYKEQLKLRRSIGRRFNKKREGPRTPEIVEEHGPPTFNIIVKADVDGTLEAILETLDSYESQECRLDIVTYGVGSITQTDIELAKVFNCVIYAFNVELPKNLTSMVIENNIPVKRHNVIYKLIDDFKEEVNNR